MKRFWNIAPVFLFMVMTSQMFMMTPSVNAQSDGDSGTPDSTLYELDAVWAVDEMMLDAVRYECWATDRGISKACLLAKMKEFLATTAAIEFARTMDEAGFLRSFEKYDSIALAYVHHPLRHNDRDRCVIVDASGQVIDPDRLENLDRTELLRDGEYRSLYDRYPSMTIWPAERSPENPPRVETLPHGRLRVLFEYRLLDGCRACKRLGYMRFAFYFDGEGAFIGRKFLGAFSRIEDKPAFEGECTGDKQK